MKKIAIINYYMTIGGAEKVLINLLSHLDYTKVSVDLFLLKITGEYIDQIPKEVSVYEFPEKILTSSTTIAKRYFKQLKIFSAFKIMFLKFMLWVSKKLKVKTWQDYFYKALMKQWGRYCLRCNSNLSKHYDSVVAFQGGFEIIQYFAGYVFDAKKRFLWVHGDMSNDNLDQKLLDPFDEFVCVSRPLEKLFCETYPKNKGKTTVIYNLLDVDEIFKKADESVSDMDTDEISIVSVGRLYPEKGFQQIPQIAKILNEKGFKFNWYIIGDGDLFESIQKDIEALNVPNVHLLGAKVNPYPYMKKCTLYVQPSFTEGYCTTTNEAKLLCKPILTTDVPGMREQFVHGENAYIVPKTTVQDIANGVELLLGDKSQMDKYSQNLKEYYIHCNDSFKDIENLFYN